MGDDLDADLFFSIIPEWVLDSEISSNAVRLYALLRRYADSTGACFPSRSTLAARMRCSRDTVDRALRELTAVSAVVVEPRVDEAGDRTTNLYRVMTTPGGSRTDAARGSRKDAATVAAPVRHRTRARELEPREGSPAAAGAVVDVTLRENASDVVAAYVDEFRATHGAEPPRQALGRIGRDARLLLHDEGRPFETVLEAAVEAARSGHPNLPSALTRVLAGGGQSRRERQLAEGLDLVRELAAGERPELWGAS